MRTTKTLVSLLVCICLCVSMITPVFAAGESNTLGVIFSATASPAVLTAGDAEQTVTVTVNASSAITVDGVGFTVLVPEGFTLVSVTSNDLPYAAGDIAPATGIFGWSEENAENVSGVTNLAVITYTVPANVAEGSYTLGVNAIELTKDYGDIWESGASATAVLTVSPEPVGYTASLNTLSSEVSVGDRVNVNVGVAHASDSVFAAGEVVVSYDSGLMTFNEEASTLGTATVKNEDGVLTLEDYGADKSFGTGVYVLAFDAVADGSAAVTLTSAAFVNKENAVKSDLIAAELAPASVSVTINKRVYDVTLPDIFEGPATVTDGEDYTFFVADGDNYDYDNVTATVDGQPVEVIDNGDGTYTVENVTGELVITGTRTEKTYSVTVTGNAADEITDAADTATYNTDYSFTMPVTEGWAYSLDSITIGGNAYTGYTVEDSVYTIPGTAINGDIVITVSKSQTIASVTVEGTGAGAAAGYETSADIGEAYTLTIVPEAGYSYTVSATMNGEAAEVTDNGNNTYTIAEVTGNIVFTVERTVVVDGVSVSQYLTLDGTVMWLVKNDTTLAEGKVPTYDGQKMFWSEKYGCFCYLVIAETLAAEDASAKVNITDGTAVDVDYGMDVNITGKVDASDCQLVYNMYNALHGEFTTDVTAEKFLRADVNGDGTVNVEDATAIIAYILG